ncbi:hypothetical protein DSOUD_2400 [Desulfuromonas soudanensis]|uniref:Divergent polysaccharide deacetylase family protein n=1 Tax=Desulfuromonas soudanensis TaxID=1603606 RepID=A0A0M5IW73_9BACT|nr:divergent polysaccharide deacetylase family protein [Desulfuromonas soudanensis]ALC17161.1 hypothetical protein DSOUD_2400 [Desulfuromonas soudanensis]
MPPRKKTRGKKRPVSKKSANQHLKVGLALLFLLVFLIGALVFLGQLRSRLLPPPAKVVPVAESVILEAMRVEIESALLRSGASMEGLEIIAEGGRTRFVVVADFPAAPLLDNLDRRLQQISADIRLEIRRQQGEVAIHRGETLPFLLQFRLPPPLEPAGKRPRLAIIIDDLGRDLETARTLAGMDLELTFAVLPGTENASRVATLAHRYQREVMVHIPMEPLSYPATNPGRDALLVGMSAEEIHRRFHGFLERVPYAVGGNNHMGSRFTENRPGMAAVMQVMKGEGLFFVDSRTSAHSVAYDEARRAGLPAAGRDVFLDNVQDVEAIVVEIRRLVRLAKAQGTAVGICHPHPETLEALRREAGIFRREGVELVPASRLLVR